MSCAIEIGFETNNTVSEYNMHSPRDSQGMLCRALSAVSVLMATASALLIRPAERARTAS
jgi:hypothetical protein